ncbi:hypothetical protein E2C01_051711 [Portunus trituberculatus]|uniref:Uncharacterized protein n=1 Tax=Portunus trituberculatus TaxID=210409 RepID=A0A5B7GMH5_PORTR|nr:hypothetical protein [Portunus trituberculatus]
MFRLIRRVVKKTPPLGPSPHSCCLCSTAGGHMVGAVYQVSLPVYDQDAISYRAPVRERRLMSALLHPDDDDGMPITEDELRQAFSRVPLIFVFVMVIFLKPGPVASSYQSPSLDQ